jgi:hypothetical protein
LWAVVIDDDADDDDVSIMTTVRCGEDGGDDAMRGSTKISALSFSIHSRLIILSSCHWKIARLEHLQCHQQTMQRPDNKNTRVQIRNTKEGGGAETAAISSLVA